MISEELTGEYLGRPRGLSLIFTELVKVVDFRRRLHFHIWMIAVCVEYHGLMLGNGDCKEAPEATEALTELTADESSLSSEC